MQRIIYENDNGQSIELTSYPFGVSNFDGSSLSLDRQYQVCYGIDGQRKTSQRYNPRTIICDCNFIGVENNRYSISKLRTLWNELLTVLSPKTNGTLYYENDIGKFKIECYPFEIPNFEYVLRCLGKFQLQFIADDPLWKSQKLYISKISQTAGGLRFPLRCTPTLFCGTWSKELTIVNETGQEIPFTIMVESVSSYVKIVNSTGDFIEVNTPLTDGQKLEVDTDKCKVTLIDTDGTRTDANYKITLDSKYFKLQQGENTIHLENGEETIAQATISYNLRYVGVC